MYATIVQCDMHAIASSEERGRMGRTLGTALAGLPGFVAFVALDTEGEAGTVAALCIVEERAAMAAVDHAIAQWQRDFPATVGTGIRRLGAGTVIAQKGL
jgi:hypothetical protein